MNTKEKSTSLGVGIILISSIFYASYGIWTKLMGDFFGGFTATAFRSLFVLLMLLPIALWRKEIHAFNFKKNSKKLVAVTTCSTLVWGPLYFAILEAGIGLSLTVNYAALVVGLLILGSIIDGEKFTPQKRLSAIIGIVGLVIIFSPSFQIGQTVLPLVAAIISGLAIAGVIVTIKKLPYNTTQSTVTLWTTSTIANIPMIFIVNESLPSFGLHIEWVYLIFFAIASIIASWLMLRGIDHIGAGLAGIVGLSEIAISVLFGVIFFSEKITVLIGIGIVLIMLAAALPYLCASFLKIRRV